MKSMNIEFYRRPDIRQPFLILSDALVKRYYPIGSTMNFEENNILVYAMRRNNLTNEYSLILIWPSNDLPSRRHG